MTNKELQEKLKEFPDDMELVTKGFMAYRDIEVVKLLPDGFKTTFGKNEHVREWVIFID